LKNIVGPACKKKKKSTTGYQNYSTVKNRDNVLTKSSIKQNILTKLKSWNIIKCSKIFDLTLTFLCIFFLIGIKTDSLK